MGNWPEWLIFLLVILAILGIVLPLYVWDIDRKFSKLLEVQNKMLKLMERLETLARKIPGDESYKPSIKEQLADGHSVADVEIIKASILGVMGVLPPRALRRKITSDFNITGKELDMFCQQLCDEGKMTEKQLYALS